MEVGDCVDHRPISVRLRNNPFSLFQHRLFQLRNVDSFFCHRHWHNLKAKILAQDAQGYEVGGIFDENHAFSIQQDRGCELNARSRTTSSEQLLFGDRTIPISSRQEVGELLFEGRFPVSGPYWKRLPWSFSILCFVALRKIGGKLHSNSGPGAPIVRSTKSGVNGRLEKSESQAVSTTLCSIFYCMPCSIKLDWARITSSDVIEPWNWLLYPMTAAG